MPDGIVTTPGATIYPRFDYGVTGLAGTMTVKIRRDSDSVVVLGPTTVGITEPDAGLYVVSGGLVAPTTAGEYSIIWNDGTAGVGHFGSEDLVVSYTASTATTPSGTDLTTVAQVKEIMERSSGADTRVDPLIQDHIRIASSMIPRRYRRDFAPLGALTRSFAGRGKIVPFRGPREAADGTLGGADLRVGVTPTVTLDPAGLAVVLTTAQYALDPFGGSSLGTYTLLNLAETVNLVNTRGYQFDRFEVTIAGTWGPVAVPDEVAYAAALTVASWLSRPIATANALESFQTAPSAEARPTKFGGFAIPDAAHAILAQYERLVIG